MQKRKNVLILQGGKNEEHEISLITGKEVHKVILKLGYSVELLNVNPNTFKEEIKSFKPDLCFNALHGPFGEDGQIQSILFNQNIPFTHSGVSASAKAFDKYKTKICLNETELNLLDSLVISKMNINNKFLERLLSKFKSKNLYIIYLQKSKFVQLLNIMDKSVNLQRERAQSIQRI